MAKEGEGVAKDVHAAMPKSGVDEKPTENGTKEHQPTDVKGGTGEGTEASKEEAAALEEVGAFNVTLVLPGVAAPVEAVVSGPTPPQPWLLS